jgi:hypothetical protein
MRAVDMPTGSAVWGYKTIRRTSGSSPDVAIGARAFLYRDGDFVANDEEIIDYASVTKLPTSDGGSMWLQEPGGQQVTHEQVDVLIASGASWRDS